MLFALGLGDRVVAVTHECDYPPAVRELPRITRDVLPAGLTSAQIDAAVKERTLRGESIYELDDDALQALEPDLIVTQALCTVCAVSYDDVRALAETLESPPRVISLDPQTVGEVLGDARTLADATGRATPRPSLCVTRPVGSTTSGCGPAPSPPAGRRSSGSIRRTPPDTGFPS